MLIIILNPLTYMNGIRPVNINEIRWIIYNGVKYVVK